MTPLVCHNHLGGEYQEWLRDRYHAVEFGGDFGKVADLTDISRDTAHVLLSWACLSKWLPWMRMGERLGKVYTMTGRRRPDDGDQMARRCAITSNQRRRFGRNRRRSPTCAQTRPSVHTSRSS